MENLQKLGITFKEVDTDIVVIKQTYPIGGNILSGKQLHTIARKYYPKHKIKPVTFQLNAPTITLEWVLEEMELLSISRKDIMNQLDVDKTTISLALSGKRPIPKMLAIALYYYFLSIRLNRTLRADISKLVAQLNDKDKGGE